jgi:hypothetical protein
MVSSFIILNYNYAFGKIYFSEISFMYIWYRFAGEGLPADENIMKKPSYRYIEVSPPRLPHLLPPMDLVA